MRTVPRSLSRHGGAVDGSAVTVGHRARVRRGQGARRGAGRGRSRGCAGLNVTDQAIGIAARRPHHPAGRRSGAAADHRRDRGRAGRRGPRRRRRRGAGAGPGRRLEPAGRRRRLRRHRGADRHAGHRRGRRGLHRCDRHGGRRRAVGRRWWPYAVARSGAGMEALSGIPGLVGATPIQNVGAYGPGGRRADRLGPDLDRIDRSAPTLFAGRVRVRLPRARGSRPHAATATCRARGDLPAPLGVAARRRSATPSWPGALGVAVGERVPLGRRTRRRARRCAPARAWC